MYDPKTGDVIVIPAGLKCFHNGTGQITVIDAEIHAVVETTRLIPPMSVTGSDAHFEESYVIRARKLDVSSDAYSPEGALLTIAVRGDFRDEFLLPNAHVVRRLVKTFVAPQ
jgi:hypothetical protein